MSNYTSRSAKGGPRAGPTTQCQKCLKRGHYTFECKAGASERPYTSRPSRSQQLANPRLRPQITNTAPERDTTGILAKTGRGRREGSRSDDIGTSERKQSRSSSRSSSVSTISTRSSRSPSPQRSKYGGRHEGPSAAQRDGPGDRIGVKRRRRSSSVSSGDRQGLTEREDARITRARKRSISPQERGRRTERLRGDSRQRVAQGYRRVDGTQEDRTNRHAESSLPPAKGDQPRHGETPRNTNDTNDDLESRGNNNGSDIHNESGPW